MHYFQYKDKALYCEEVSIDSMASEVGTPFYLYSYRTMVRHYKAFQEAFLSVPHLICYSVKANSNLSVLKTFVDLGSGVDTVSGGEIYRALKAGADPEKIVFSGVGKKEEEIEYGLKTGILMFNVESAQELEAINRIAKRLELKAPISLRVNPDVDPQTHPYISTGFKNAKFGIDITIAKELYRHARSLKNIDVIGVDCHIGSQLTSVAPFIDALRKIKEMIQSVREDGTDIKYLDLGGGLGITYREETPPHPTTYGEAITKEVEDLDIMLIFEPGRVLVGNAGILVTRVIYTKENAEKNFIIVDAAMNDLARPALYGSYHGIKPVQMPDSDEEVTVDVVGPICETGDFLAKEIAVPVFKRGDLMAVMSVGAYGFTMSSNYNSRPRAAEVIVKGDEYTIIRERESYEDLIRGEKIVSL
ncbi:MAG: diaminopimelate decarboxylase [Thermodesulfobacteriota bacterium]